MTRSMRVGIGLTVALVTAIYARATLADGCPSVPPSRLSVERLEADRVTERSASVEEIAALGNPADGPAPHPLMGIAYDFDEHFAVEHRLIAAVGGGYCDAPDTIILRFGAIARNVFVAEAAEKESCVRAALLAHESEHNKAFNAAVSAFLYRHRADLAEEMVRLKSRAAATENGAKQAFQSGIQQALARLLQSFRQEEVGRIRQLVDSPDRLGSLRSACNGRVGELEKTVGPRPRGSES